ncbi:diguanylate cyclase [Alcanivorax sp. JB21]|uniref:GGDEF domain-containing protein n=1 Tax=Alcanivorax limicola TaxID=2874102 RepID=UPI001CBE60D5|nr:diguanylate cyclase [Alcanivorax limicola]MBZ2188094.1 diguanylate cyclase [Alcanivorax limicola]
MSASTSNDSLNIGAAGASTRSGLSISAQLRMLDEALECQIAFCERRALPLNLLAIYVANFEALASEYGHELARRMQRLLNEQIGRCKRTEDWICAWGDGRLVFCLPDTPPRGARRLAHRILAQLSRHSFRYQGQVLRMQLRLGLHTLSGDQREDPRKLMMRTLHTATQGAEDINVSLAMKAALDTPAPAFSHDRYHHLPALTDVLPNNTSTPEQLKRLLADLNESERMALMDELILSTSR